MQSNNNSHTFMVFSASEAAKTEGAGYWNNEHGWTTAQSADVFTHAERSAFTLPMSTGNDAQWLTLEDDDNEGSVLQVRAVIDVTYLLNGHTPDELLNHLHAMLEDFAGGGGLTGATDCTVDQWSVEADVREPILTECEVETLMRQRMESGDISLSDIPGRLARYGLMEPQVFSAEMRERLQMTHEEDGMALGI